MAATTSTHTLSQLHHHYGAHFQGGSCTFRVYAPNAKSVGLVTKLFEERVITMNRQRDHSWSIKMSIEEGTPYAYLIVTKNDETLLKNDPFAIQSILSDRGLIAVAVKRNQFKWSDQKWMANRHNHPPTNVYEMQPSSWKRKPDGVLQNYRELAHELVGHAKEMHNTHIELMDVFGHIGSDPWAGYRPSCFFSSDHKFGSRKELKYLIDLAHKESIGIIIDVVIGHVDKASKTNIVNFDGTRLYELEEERWGSHAINFEKPEVRNYFLSSARYWLENFHIDGLRIDNVEGFAKGGSCDAGVAFCKELNTLVHTIPGAFTIAEDTSGVDTITNSIENDGWGFDYRWNFHAPNAFRHLMRTAPSERHHQYDQIVHAFQQLVDTGSKSTIGFSHDDLRLSDDGPGSLFSSMPGESSEEKRNQLRLLFGLQKLAPSAGVLNFMGNDFASTREWPLMIDGKEVSDLHWQDEQAHRPFSKFLSALNEIDLTSMDFEWLKNDDNSSGIIAFKRGPFVCIFNFGDQSYPLYELGVPFEGNNMKERFCSNPDHAPEMTCSEHKMRLTKFRSESFFIYENK
ncbi:MAG: alpha amylase C-terminal domain-containing protein [Simkaniaceae bacterium]|nr:alpha amylase C-terminal domain-containing protein [Simkaniaceae bacterium]